MSSFSNAPHLLTKEKLKSALKANGIPLPRADQKKAFYVDLYLENLTSQNEEEFSSDESEELSGSSPMWASKKLPTKQPQKIVINKRVKGGLPFDVGALSDGDLARQLKSFGTTIGPITDSTRPIYQKKLAKLLTEEMQAPPAPAPAPAPAPVSKISPKQKKTLSPKLQKKEERTDFSDGDDADDASTEELEVETVEHLSYNHDRQDQQDSPPHELPPPTYRSTPAKSTPRKRAVTSTLTTRQQTRKVYNENKGETETNGLEQNDSVQIIAVKKPVKKQAEPAKEEESNIFGPHIQILLAVLVFLVFTVFLVYYLMEETPQDQIEGDTK